MLEKKKLVLAILKSMVELIQKKQAKGKNITQIADELEMTEEEVQRVLDKQKEMSEN